MTEYVTGQIYGWNGGECPVHPETKVEVWFRHVAGSRIDRAIDWRRSWLHLTGSNDIIAFKVVTPYVEPKVIWVNEYADGYGAAYPSEERAKRADDGYHTRVAVKYVEVKND